MRDRSRTLSGHGEACNSERSYGGGSAWWCSMARGVLGSGRTYWSWQLVQKEEKGVLRLTEGVRASRKALQGADVVDRRRRRAAVMEGSGGGRLGASGPGGSTQWDLAVLGDGAAWPERHRQRRIVAAELLL